MSKETSESVALGCLTTLVSLVIAGPIRAWCLIQVYDWHIRPTFGGPHWTVIQVWAFNVFLSLLIWDMPADVEAPKRTVAQQGVRTVVLALSPLLWLALAWCLR